MVVNYAIKAQIVDITIDTPKPSDVFLVDTNVWYWMTYTRASQTTWPPAQYQTTHYPTYANRALGVGAKIFQSGLSLAELTHLIEKSEREIYQQTRGIVAKPKEYRHNLTSERSRVISEIQAAWAQVTSLAAPLTVTIDMPTTNAAMNRLKTEQLDGYDLYIIESMKSHGVAQVITDDGDFATVAGIQMVTGNKNVLRLARTQGKLFTR